MVLFNKYYQYNFDSWVTIKMMIFFRWKNSQSSDQKVSHCKIEFCVDTKQIYAKQILCCLNWKMCTTNKTESIRNVDKNDKKYIKRYTKVAIVHDWNTQIERKISHECEFGRWFLGFLCVRSLSLAYKFSMWNCVRVLFWLHSHAHAHGTQVSHRDLRHLCLLFISSSLSSLLLLSSIYWLLARFNDTHRHFFFSFFFYSILIHRHLMSFIVPVYE